MYQVGTHASLECGECCLCQFFKHVESHAIHPPISIPSLICDIFSVQKKYIVSCDDEIGATPSVLTLSYMLIVENDGSDIVIHIITLVDETDQVLMDKCCMGL